MKKAMLLFTVMLFAGICHAQNCTDPCSDVGGCQPGYECQAYPSPAQCFGECINVMTDPNNCGSIGHVCSYGQICQFGVCVDDPNDCFFTSGGPCMAVSLMPKRKPEVKLPIRLKPLPLRIT